ncbi:putative lipoprotein [Aliivibrio salmonicida LFI1238]|uniref:Lipoprotein n=1 Tax=Aliivibrio salmonicida (strain LFI1238) TaxID=316275 RepID=B6EL66_ALISL|nr:putative lipoprotein [Aliivibrio salmonicida LFI1238]
MNRYKCVVCRSVVIGEIVLKKFVWLIAFLIVGCSDVMDNYYPTYQDALENKLFTRGWLPNILPESTKKIEVSNDLDLNTSVGRFVIDKQDRDAFISQLTLVDIKKNRFEYYSGQSVWAFNMEDNGVVRYTLSVNR